MGNTLLKTSKLISLFLFVFWIAQKTKEEMRGQNPETFEMIVYLSD